MKNFKNPNRLKSASAGFRVVTLVALLGAGGGGWWYLNDLKNPTPEELDAQKNVARADIVSEMVPIRSKLRAFKDETGAYPTTDEGLAALVTSGKLTQADLEDKFGNKYQYKGPSDPASDGKTGQFELFSNGEDGKSGTPDDISSSEVASPPES